MNLDDTLRVLADERRRDMLYMLEESDSDSFTYSEVIEAVWNGGDDSEDYSNQLKIEMTHVHLPKMEEKGVLEYDERSEIIRYDPDEELRELLGVVEELD